MNNMNEDSLVKKCVQGSRKAQKELFDRYAPKMLAVATRYIGDHERAEDVLQDSFVKVFKHLTNFKLAGSLEGWIRKIVVNTALDQLRKEKKYKSDIELDSVNFEIGQSSDAEEMMQADFLLDLVKQLP
jgi:RNA polymerase sigma factor (sigma-70 family)